MNVKTTLTIAYCLITKCVLTQLAHMLVSVKKDIIMPVTSVKVHWLAITITAFTC